MKLKNCSGFFQLAFLLLPFIAHANQHPQNFTKQFSHDELRVRGIKSDRITKEMLRASQWQAIDPTLIHANDLKIRHQPIAGGKISRITPLLDGIPIEGADRVVTIKGNEIQSVGIEAPIDPHGQFKLSRAQAVEKAMPFSRMGLVRDPNVERLNRFSKKVWLQRFGELRPSFRVRIPSLMLEDLRDVWIDAENGDVLKIEPAAWFDEAPAKVFVYSPPPGQATTEHLVDVTLKGLVSASPGSKLIGHHFGVKNSPRYYTCVGGGAGCDEQDKVCATASTPGAIKSDEIFAVAKGDFGLEDVESIPSTLWIIAPASPRIPCAEASADGFVLPPIDGQMPEAETDHFVEVQTHFLLQTMFDHVRELLNDPTFCQNGMDCGSDGSARLGPDGLPLRNFRVFTNEQLPDLKVSKDDDDDPEGFVNQLAAGRGTQSNPIVLRDFKRVCNAAFVTGVPGDPSDYDLALDDIFGRFLQPWDYNIFFQCDETDLAYDGEVVFHEFIHAVIATLVRELASLGLDGWGLHAEPGALNEGYADYFAASFTNSSQIGEYTAHEPNGDGEIGLRNLDNTAACPQDVSGELHDDSLIFSGALWDIRDAVVNQVGAPAVKQLDSLFLAALAQSNANESFSDQSGRIINALDQHPLFAPQIAKAAQDTFASRGVSECERAYLLGDVDGNNQVIQRPKKSLHLFSPASLGFKQFSPPPMPLKIKTPPGAGSVDLEFRQFFKSGSFLPMAARGDAQPLRVVVTENPIEWRYENREPVPYVEGQRLDIDLSSDNNQARFERERWRYQHTLDATSCESKTLYVSLLTTDNDYVLRDVTHNVNLSAAPGATACSTSGCTSYSSSPGNVLPGLLFAGLLLLIRRRFVAKK